MSDIKAGMIVNIKSTDEPAFVLAIEQGPTQHVQGFKVDGPVAWVRRPRVGNDGVQHSIELFHLMELETIEEGQRRKLAEMEELKARYGPKGTNGDTPASNMVLPN